MRPAGAAVGFMILAWTGAAAAAHAAFQTGSNVLRFCESDMPIERGLCLGYIESAADALNARRAAASPACLIPEGVKAIEVRDIVVGVLQEHPETRDEDAFPLISRVIADAWPCHRK